MTNDSSCVVVTETGFTVQYMGRGVNKIPVLKVDLSVKLVFFHYRGQNRLSTIKEILKLKHGTFRRRSLDRFKICPIRISAIQYGIVLQRSLFHRGINYFSSLN